LRAVAEAGLLLARVLAACVLRARLCAVCAGLLSAAAILSAAVGVLFCAAARCWAIVASVSAGLGVVPLAAVPAVVVADCASAA
jgi:hypothetical protein